MAIRLVHIVDENVGEHAAKLCSLLMRRLPAGEVSQRVLTLGRPSLLFDRPEHVPLVRVNRLTGWPVLSALPLQRVLQRERPDAILAWSVPATVAVGWAAGDWLPIGVVCDPAEARQLSRWRQAMAWAGRDFDLVCTSGTVQRRLVESGTPMEATCIIRPGVDFAALRHAKQTMDRQRLGLPATGRVLLTMSPPSRAGGQYLAVWATAILHHIWPDATLIVPGTSREQQRIGRLVEGIYCPGVFRLTANEYSPAELLAVADALVVPAVGDVPTGWLAWAMAAGAPIIGSAVPCVAEFIADRQNGLLCRPGEPHTLAICIREAFDSPELLASCARAASQQAYETFRAERCVDEFLRLVRNLAGGRPPFEGVRDAAAGS